MSSEGVSSEGVPRWPDETSKGLGGEYTYLSYEQSLFVIHLLLHEVVQQHLLLLGSNRRLLAGIDAEVQALAQDAVNVAEGAIGAELVLGDNAVERLLEQVGVEHTQVGDPCVLGIPLGVELEDAVLAFETEGDALDV